MSNRVKQTKDGVVTNYTYDANDRLTEETGARTASYTYDKQGNTLAQTVNGVTTNYSYNAKHELIQANDVSFNYDIDGVRSSKTKDNTTIDYTTDKNRDYAQVVLEKQNNQTVASYTYGDDLLSQTISTGTNFYGYDGLGSTKFLTDTNGAITDTYQYDAYGEITSQTGTTDNNYLYTGEQYDRSLNQYYLRARYYNQGVGRFTQMDTWQGRMHNPTTLNKYLYADVRPTMYTDPSGHMSLGGLMAGINVRGTLSTMGAQSFSRAITQAVGAALKQGGKAATKQVIRTLRRCIKKRNKCELGFNLLIVGNDNPDMVDHISEAQNAHTIVLTYDKNPRSKNRSWYRGKGGCRLKKPDPSYQCDEYPFFKTKEGGPANYRSGMGLVSLKWVSGKQNMSVGGHFGFLARNMQTDDDFVVVTATELPTFALPMSPKKKKGK